MISIMNNNDDFELDRKSDLTGDEPQSKAMVSGDIGVVSSHTVGIDDGDGGCYSTFIRSEENGISQGGVVDSSNKSINGGYDVDKSVNLVGSEEIGVLEGLVNRASESDVNGRFLVGGANTLESSGSGKTRDSQDGWKGAGEEMRYGASDIRNEDAGARNFGSRERGFRVEEDGFNYEDKGLVELTSRSNDHKFDVQNGGVEHSGSRLGKGHVEVGKSSVSMFDEFAANEMGEAIGAGLSTSVGYGYEIGDMIWGKVKSHPWWPGHIYTDAFALPSVRWTKRAGHVLVAFFGDNSYGWFDPAELLPFDAYFSEKLSQTNSRNFVKAMEEAVNEASRRRGLGLTCRCRNPYNFRPTSVQGYLAVDVDDYEPGGVYSLSQIIRARDNFQPRDTVAFMKQLALMPTGNVSGNIEFIKNKSTVLAYRRAVFEEFDETYAQAFGQQPVRPSRPSRESMAQPIRAPLSGRLVIAEVLGKRKNSTKANKANDLSNKDRYLFKRRDEPNESKVQQIRQGTSSMQPAFVEGSTELVAGNYLLQKRAPKQQQIPGKLARAATLGIDDGSVSNRGATREEVVTIEDKASVAKFFNVAGALSDGSKSEQPSSVADSFPAWQAPSESSNLSEPKSAFDKGKGALLGPKEHGGNNAMANLLIADGSGSSEKGRFHGGMDDILCTSKQDGEATFNLKHGRQSATASRLDEGFQQPSSLPQKVEAAHEQEQVHSIGSAVHVLPTIDANFHGQGSRICVDTGTKKAKLLKRLVGELGGEKSSPGEKKKKKKKAKKELGMEMCSDHLPMQAATGKGGSSFGRVNGKSIKVGLPSREDFLIEHRKIDDGPSSSLLPESLGMRQSVGMGNIDPKLPQLLGDLQALALNSFHGVERNIPSIIQQAFLRFRSVVYQKSLALSSSAEMESNYVRDSPGGNMKGLPSLKPSKLPLKSGDPTKPGRKRGPSDRQEELAAKRSKKINDLKSLAVDKKAAQKTLDAQRDGKETAALRPLKPDSVKKMEPRAKAPEPTALVMKFPPKTSLPSGSELKARLARFGPLDHSATRIFWQTLTCRVVFLHRVDAEAAHRHLTGNNALFGNVNVRCHIRPLGATAPESESKVQTDDATMETMQLRNSAVEQRPAAAGPAQQQQPLQHRAVQLRSCLKKPMGDETGITTTTTGSNGGGGRGATPRVKFMLVGGESSVVGEQLMVGNKNNFNNASFGDGGASSSHGMDFNSKNFQKVISPPPPPQLPPPVAFQFPNAPINLHYTEVALRNTHNLKTETAVAVPVPSATDIDLAQQMLGLLIKCNDLVTNVSSFLGYVPYHPL